MNAGLERAIETARRHIPIQKRVVKPEFWCGYTICLDERGLHHVYENDSWIPPNEAPMLPWSPPPASHLPIGYVDLNGNYTEIEETA